MIMQATISANQIQIAKDNHFQAMHQVHACYAAKQKAWQYFSELGLPTPKTEQYKYTPITNKLADAFDLSQPIATSQLTKEAITACLDPMPDAYQLVLLNGQLSSTYSNLGHAKLLFEVLTFTEAFQQQHPLFIQHFAQYEPAQAEVFAALNTVLFEEGIFIHIADQAILDKPLFIYHITDSSYTQGLAYPRILIQAGKNSQASLVASWHAIGAYPSFTNAVTEICLNQDAQLTYYHLQTKDLDQAYQVHATHCYQASKSILNHYSFTLDGLFVRNNLQVHSNASHSETNMYGIYCLDKQQHVDNHTIVDHKQPNTQSSELYRGILAGQASGVFNGKIYVRAQAQQTNAFQANNNLLVSDQATIHTKPQLEIWADDVKCSHGATTGQLDEAQLFYLQARGIPTNMARYMLLNAFASEVIQQVPLLSLKQYLQTALTAKLTSFHTIEKP